MKLCTDIKPRRDGKVNVTVAGKTYTFSGEPLAADVEDESDVSYLLALGTFYPENAEDFERAGITLGAALTANQDDDDEEDDEIENDEALGGAPVEALTPAKPKAAPAKPKAKAK